MKHVPVTISDTAQPVPLRDAGVVLADIYDPVRERAVARRLRGARWRRLALVVTAVSISAAAAASFTLMNREMIQADLVRRAEPLAGADRPFRHSAREILALAALKAGDRATAERWIKAIQDDRESPQGVRGRADLMSTVFSASGS